MPSNLLSMEVVHRFVLVLESHCVDLAPLVVIIDRPSILLKNGKINGDKVWTSHNLNEVSIPHCYEHEVLLAYSCRV